MNNIKEEFYKTFEIEKQRRLWTPKEGFKNYYPPITDRILLELICILNKDAIISILSSKTSKELKESILKDCIRHKSKVFKQIQQLFKGEE